MDDQFTATDERPVSFAQTRIAFVDNLLRAATRPEHIAEVVAEIIGDHVETGRPRWVVLERAWDTALVTGRTVGYS